MSLTLRNTALFLQEVPSVIGEVALAASATMTADAKMVYHAGVDFEGTSTFVSNLGRLITADAEPMEVTAEWPEIEGAYIAIYGASLMVATAELDPSDTEMQRGGTAALSVSASLSPGSGSITYYSGVTMTVSATGEIIGGIEWHGELPLSLSVTLDSAGLLGTVGLNDPGFVTATATVDGDRIIGGLTDENWRATATMEAAEITILGAQIAEMAATASMGGIGAGLVREFGADMTATAAMLTIAFDPDNVVLEWNASAQMAADALVQQGGWLDMVATAELAISEENFYRYRSAEVGDSGGNGQEPTPGLTASAYLDVVLDGLVAGRPYALRASAKMTTRGRLGGDVYIVEGSVDFRPQLEIEFEGIILSFGAVGFEQIAEFTADGSILIVGDVDFLASSAFESEATILQTQQTIYFDTIEVASEVFNPTLVPLVVTIWMDEIEATVEMGPLSATGGVTRGLLVAGSDRKSSFRVAGSDSPLGI